MSYFDLGTKRYEPSSLPVLIRTSIGDDAIKPRAEVRIFAKLIYRRKQFQKDLLRYITRHRLVAAVMKRDCVDPIFVGLKQVAECIAVTLLASLDHLSFCSVITHSRELLHKIGHP